MKGIKMKDIKLMNLQLFTEGDDINKKADFEPAISVDFTSRIASNIASLQQILGIEQAEPMAEGSVIKVYNYGTVTPAAQVAEGVKITATKVTRTLAKTINLTLEKFRRETTAEAIQRVGRNVAINQADEKLIGAVRKRIKTSFFAHIMGGTGTATAGATLQAALANVWGAMQKGFEDEDVTPIFFVSSDDVASYLGTANVSTQTAFGFTYLENFLGLGTAIVSPSITKGAVYGTAKENLHMAYIPTSGSVGQLFGLTSDATGLVGMTHGINTDKATIDTLLMEGVEFYPEFQDKIYKATVTGA